MRLVTCLYSAVQFFLSRDAMHSVVYAMTPCQCVRLSVTFVYSCIETSSP